MPLNLKKLVYIGALILIGGMFFVLWWNREPGTSNSTSSEIVAPASSTNERVPYAAYHKLVNVIDGKTVKNTMCGFTFTIPADWSISGLLGGSKILSPEDKRENEEWAETHQELFQNTEGEGPIGPDARSLYISCQYNTETYLGYFSRSPYFKNFESTTRLADAFTTGAFSDKGSNPGLIKTMDIDGRVAYEISETNKVRDGSLHTNYVIILEQKKVVEIHLGQIEYDNLSDTVKQIIQSISFEE